MDKGRACGQGKAPPEKSGWLKMKTSNFKHD